MRPPFSLISSHYLVIGITIFISLLAIIILFFSGSFLQVPGIFWFAIISSFIAQLITKFSRLRINYEIAFGIGIFTLIATHLMLFPLWIIVGENDIPLGTFAAYFSIIFLIGVVQQLITSLIFIKFGNET